MNTLERNRYTARGGPSGRRCPRPRAVLVISAHWYINATAVTAMARPRTIHDFFGFPQAVRRPVPRARPAGAGRGGRRGRQAALGGPGLRQLGPRPRHLVGAGAHVPRGRHPRGAAVHQRHQALGLPPRAGRAAGAAARARGADRRQRQRRAQPAQSPTGEARRRLRLGAAVRRGRRTVMLDDPTEVAALDAHPDFAAAVPTPDHFIPLLYLAGLAGAGRGAADVLVDGYAYGSLSMTAYTPAPPRPRGGGAGPPPPPPPARAPPPGRGGGGGGGGGLAPPPRAPGEEGGRPFPRPPPRASLAPPPPRHDPGDGGVCGRDAQRLPSQPAATSIPPCSAYRRRRSRSWAPATGRWMRGSIIASTSRGWRPPPSSLPPRSPWRSCTVAARCSPTGLRKPRASPTGRSRTLLPQRPPRRRDVAVSDLIEPPSCRRVNRPAHSFVYGEERLM